MPSVRPTFKAVWRMSDVRKFIDARIAKRREMLIDLFKQSLIEAVDTASNRKEYQNQTAALINSTGGRLYEDGEMLFDYYPNNVPPRTGEPPIDGKQKGRDLADYVGLAKAEKGLVIVVTAAMDYAIFVEAKGKDVLTGTMPESKRNIVNKLLKLKSGR